MADSPIQLTRAQLAEFLPDSRTIKAFEQLFLATGTEIPDDLTALQRDIQDVSAETGTATSKVDLALALLSRIQTSLDLLALAPARDITGLRGPQGEPGQSVFFLPEEPDSEDFTLPPTSSSLTLNDLRMLGTITPDSVAGIVGTTTNDNPNAGSVGEFLTATASLVAIVNGVAKTITSLSLTAGDWLVWATVGFNPSGANLTQQVGSTSSVTNTLGGLGEYFSLQSAAALGSFFSTPVSRKSVAPGGATLYAVAYGAFAAGTCTANATLCAVRIR